MPKNIEATKNILTQNALKAEQAGDDEAFKKATDGLAAIKRIAEISEGGDAELTRIKGYRTDMQSFLQKQLSTQRTELEGSGIVSFDSAGNVSKILKPKEYKAFRIKQLNNYKQTYVTRLKGTKLANFNEAYNLVIGGDAVKIALEDTNTKNNLNPEVKVPEATKIKLPVPDDRIIKDIQTSGKQVVIDSLVNSANYTREEAEAKVESLTGKLGYGTYGINPKGN